MKKTKTVSKKTTKTKSKNPTTPEEIGRFAESLADYIIKQTEKLPVKNRADVGLFLLATIGAITVGDALVANNAASKDADELANLMGNFHQRLQASVNYAFSENNIEAHTHIILLPGEVEVPEGASVN